MLPLIDRTALVKTALFECPFVNGLIRTIENHGLLSTDCKQALMKCAKLQTLQAQEMLLEPRQTNDRLYWVETGLIRFFLDADDITIGFCREGDFFCAVSSFFAQSHPQNLSVPKKLRVCSQLATPICKGFLAGFPK